jgi:hypothetical protein
MKKKKEKKELKNLGVEADICTLAKPANEALVRLVLSWHNFFHESA